MDQTILKSHVEKPEKFKGSDFHRWQQKMLFYLTSLHVSYVFTDSKPVDPYLVDGQNVPTKAQMADYEKAASQWNHNEYNCKKYILNALDDSLYDIYSTFATAREIWESLEKKYRTQVACSKKFFVGKFLNFKMNDAKPDAKPVAKQVEELQIIVHEMEVEGIGINSNFLVGSIIEKLPQFWKNFKLYLKHLTDDMSFEQLVLKIRVESNHKKKGKNGGDSGQKYSKDGKKDYTQQKDNNFKKVYHCWVCGKPGHKAKDCRHKKEHGGGNFGGNSNQANHVQSPKEFAGVIESFLTTNVVDWWYDTCYTKHICNLRRMFVSYQKVNELELMFMGNGTSLKIEGKGKVILKLTSGK
ncbi:DNA polymerase zeta catalytic subunit-like protein, partial [Tanacetum coccineum]